MNEEDRKRFARYYPDYIEPPEEDNSDKDVDSDNNEEKKNILGYIDKINIDKDKLISETIMNNN